MVEQRVIGQKIGARPAAPAAPPPREPEPAPAADKPEKKGGGKKRLFIILGALVLVAVAAAVYLFVLKPGDAAAAEPTPEPTPTPVAGAVLKIDPVSVNLAGGHYLRLGLALQLTADVAEDPDPSKALDLAIAWYSGRPIDEVTDSTTREELKEGLLDQIEEAYDGEVMDLYLTDYVTQ